MRRIDRRNERMCSQRGEHGRIVETLPDPSVSKPDAATKEIERAAL